jgi:hypothetical protein
MFTTSNTISLLINSAGYFLLLKIIYKVLIILYETVWLKELRLIKRYGEKSWVFITGATDGVGWSLCNKMA